MLAFRWPVDSAAPDIDVGGLEVKTMVIARNSNLLRRITILLIICCSSAVVLSPNTAAALPGSGTQEDPYRIESLADFDEFAADPNYWSGFTRLQTDVNLAGRTYTTAVIAPYPGTAFTGFFDGNGHKILNLTIASGAVNDFIGLFGVIVEDGQVSNLRLEGNSVTGRDYVGGLVGINSGSILNCYSTGGVNGLQDVGGLVGGNGIHRRPGIVSNCYSTGDVSGVEGVGGLVGRMNWGSITDCYSSCTVFGYSGVGGLVGCNVECYRQCLGGLIKDCHSSGDVNGTDWCVGGLVGDNWGTISNCYSTGDVNGVDYVGVLVGLNRGSVSNCYSIGDVSGEDRVGGLVGGNGVYNIMEASLGYISNSYSTGSVQGGLGVGGLVGYNECGAIQRSFWDVQTSGEPNMCGGQDETWATGCDPNCGKTTAEMQTRSTFSDAAWDFVDIWLINEGATYPVLRQEIRSDLSGDGGIDLLDFAIFADHWLEGTAD
jgi:hypothetical protein